MHYLLFYEKAPDYEAREASFTAAHRAHVFAAVARGELILGGPLTNPVDGANVLLFRASTPDVPTAFAQADPYVQGGIVSRWHVRPWQTVVGAAAEFPVAHNSVDAK